MFAGVPRMRCNDLYVGVGNRYQWRAICALSTIYDEKQSPENLYWVRRAREYIE